jgi:hypothetical protein
LAVDLKFYDANGSEISLDKSVGGHDFGTVRKGQQYVYPVVVKNVGSNDAKGLYVKGSPLNSINDANATEYNNQVRASTWKSFSLLPNRDFVTQLNLPNIPANSTMIGKQEFIENFTNPANSYWKNDTLTGHLFQWTGTGLVCTPTNGETSTTSFFARADATGWGNAKEADCIFKFLMPNTSVAGSSFGMIGFRMNSLGDEKGYIVNLKRVNTNNTCFFEIRKCAGIKASGTTDFGSVLYTSNSVPYADYTPIRIKIFTNSDGLPEIKVWVTNINDTDPPVQWGTTNPTQSYVDTSNTYKYAGGICFIFGSAGTNLVSANKFELRYASLLTDDPNGKVYISTIVSDGAEDSITYNSSMELFYDPV